MKRIPYYAAIDYMVFMACLFLTSPDSKFIKWSDIKSGSDLFLFTWLFVLPGFLYYISTWLPIGLLLNNRRLTKTALLVILVLIEIFEFILTSWIYGTSSAAIKVIVKIFFYLHSAAIKKNLSKSLNSID